MTKVDRDRLVLVPSSMMVPPRPVSSTAWRATADRKPTSAISARWELLAAVLGGAIAAVAWWWAVGHAR